MNGPVVSIVTASFNALAGLKATVESVAGQSYHAVEHIVIDGGSTDGTTVYLRSLGEQVHWISEPDEGIGDALRKGVAMATGEYVLILQAEDHFQDADSLQGAIRQLGDEDLTSFAVLLRDGDSDTKLHAGSLGLRSRLFMPLPHQGLIARRALFERIGNFDPTFRIAVDYEWLVRARKAGATSRVVNEVLAIMPETGISTRRDWPTLRKRLTECQRLHFSHANSIERLLYSVWWALYRPYKRLRSLGQ